MEEKRKREERRGEVNVGEGRREEKRREKIISIMVPVALCDNKAHANAIFSLCTHSFCNFSSSDKFGNNTQFKSGTYV